MGMVGGSCHNSLFVLTVCSYSLCMWCWRLSRLSASVKIQHVQPVNLSRRNISRWNGVVVAVDVFCLGYKNYPFRYKYLFWAASPTPINNIIYLIKIKRGRRRTFKSGRKNTWKAGTSLAHYDRKTCLMNTTKSPKKSTLTNSTF